MNQQIAFVFLFAAVCSVTLGCNVSTNIFCPHLFDARKIELPENHSNS